MMGKWVRHFVQFVASVLCLCFPFLASGQSLTEEPPREWKVSGDHIEVQLCAGQASDGPCVGPGGKVIEFNAFGTNELNVTHTRSTGAFACNIFNRRDGYSPGSGTQIMTVTNLSSEPKMSRQALDFVWAECSGVTGSVVLDAKFTKASGVPSENISESVRRELADSSAVLARQSPTVALTFDDNRASHLLAAQELAARGLVGTFFIHVGPWMGAYPIGTAIENELTESDAFQILALGSDLQSHFADPAGVNVWLSRSAARNQCTDIAYPWASCTGADAWTNGDNPPTWSNTTLPTDLGNIRGVPRNLQLMLEHNYFMERQWAVQNGLPYFVAHRPPGNAYSEFMSSLALSLYDFISTTPIGWVEQQPYWTIDGLSPSGRPGMSWTYVPQCRQGDETGCADEMLEYLRGAADSGSGGNYMNLTFHSIVSDDQCGNMSSGIDYNCCGQTPSCNERGNGSNEYPINEFRKLADGIAEMQQAGIMQSVTMTEVVRRSYEGDPVNKLANSGFGSRSGGAPDGWINGGWAAEPALDFDPLGATNMICRTGFTTSSNFQQNVAQGSLVPGKNYWFSFLVRQDQYDADDPCVRNTNTFAQLSSFDTGGNTSSSGSTGFDRQLLRSVQFKMGADRMAQDAEWLWVASSFVAGSDQMRFRISFNPSGCAQERLCMAKPRIIERQVQPSTASTGMNIFSPAVPVGSKHCTYHQFGSLANAASEEAQIQAIYSTRGESNVPAYGQGHSAFHITSIRIGNVPDGALFDFDFRGKSVADGGHLYSTLTGVAAAVPGSVSYQIPVSAWAFSDRSPNRTFAGAGQGGDEAVYPWQDSDSTLIGTNEIWTTITNRSGATAAPRVELCFSAEGV